MLNVNSLRLVGLGLAALLTLGAALSSTALYAADSPGSDLEPVGGAEMIVDLIQGQEAILWSSVTGTVNQYQVLGWPTTDGENELGGALVIERPTDGTVGVIDIGEKPMSIEFDVSG
jgi:hypothetical protein